MSIIKLKSVDADYPALDLKITLKHFNNKLQTLETAPALIPWQQEPLFGNSERYYLAS